MNSTREENIIKLKKVSGVFEKITHVLKILAIVGAIIMAVYALFALIAGLTGLLNKLYETYPDFIGKFEISYDSKSMVFIDKRSLTFKELYEEGLLNKFMYGNSLVSLSISAELVIYAIIIHFIRKVFLLINQNETPFSVELLKPFKVCFIILTLVIVFRYSLIPGLIIGGILACIYFIYSYGCNMQEDEDLTL